MPTTSTLNPSTRSPTGSTQLPRVAPDPSARPPTTRVGLVDRLALRAGVALVAWSRRPRRGPSRDELARRYENDRDRERRELAADRRRYLLAPPR